MNKDLLKTFGHAGIYTVGIILNRAVSFLMLPIYTRFLTPADYGILELLEMTVDVVSIVAGVGIVNGLSKFYYQYETETARKEVVSTIFLMVIAFYSTACLISGFSSSTISNIVFRTSKYGYCVAISFVNLFLQFLTYVPLAYIRTKQKSMLFVLISTVSLVLQLSLNILFLIYLRKGLIGVLYSTMISSFVTSAILTIYTFSRVGFRFSGEKAGRLLKFGLPFVLSGFGAFILTFSDRYFLNHYRNLSQVGIYSLGYKFGFLLMAFPIQPLFNIWMVQRFELVNKQSYEKNFNQFLSWFFIITLAVGLFVSLTARDVLRIMSAPAFWGAYRIVPIVILAYFLQACTDFFNFGIFYTGKTKHIAYGTIVSTVVIIGLSFLLIPRYGMFGAAWATLVAFSVRLIYVYFASQKLFKIPYDLKRPAGVLGMSVVIYLVYWNSMELLHLDNLFMSFSMSALSFTAFCLFLFLFKIITPEERRIFSATLRSPFKTLAEIKSQLAG
jgi:O-antigen/teichoic acid export membrane protein